MKTKKPLPAFLKNIMDAKDKANAPKKGMTKMANGGSASSRADGVATQAPTKGTMVGMKRGGSCK